MRARVALLALAAALAGCGGGKHGASDASVPRLVTQSLEAARAAHNVRFVLHLEATAKLDARRLDRAPFPRGRLEALANHPFRIAASGARSDEILTASGRVEEAGRVYPFRLLQAGGRLLIGLGGSWYRIGHGLGDIFRAETFAGLVPLEACIRGGETEGCDRVDFGRALARGDLGRLVRGSVRHEAGATEISGTVDAEAFAAFHRGGGAPTFRPYEREGKIELVLGRDRLPRRFVFSYRLDRDALEQHLRGEASLTPVVERTGRVEIDLSHWREPVRAAVPGPVHRPATARLRRLFNGLLEALYLFY